MHQPIQSVKQMYWGRVVDTCVEECNTLSSNSEKIVKHQLLNFKSLDKTVSIKEISTDTSSTKNPITLRRDVIDGKPVYHFCVDIKCCTKTWLYSAASADAKDKLSLGAKAGLTIVNTFPEFQDPRCIEIKDHNNILGDLFSDVVDKPGKGKILAMTRSTTPGSPPTPSNSPFNPFF